MLLATTLPLHLAGVVVALLVAPLLLLWRKRHSTVRLLSSFPVVYWRPRFSTYNVHTDRHKLSSKSITQLLPRAQRLAGPYDLYGTLYGLFTPVLHVVDPTPARAILSSSTTQKSPAYNHFDNFCGQGVFTADGPAWQAQRTAVLHALLRNNKYEQTILAEALTAQGHLWEAVDQAVVWKDTSNKSGILPDVVPLLQKTTIGLIYRYLTHSDLADLDDDATKTTKSSNNQSPDDTPEPLLDSYLRAITHIRMLILAQSRSVWFLLPRWCYRCFSSLYAQEERAMQPIRQVAKIALQQAQPSSPLAQLDYASPKTLLDETITLLFAGQDTSAATLSWTLYLLSRHPQVQDKLYDEVKDISLENATKSDLLKLSYLDAVLKESMRLYPVAPFVVRRVTQAIALDDKTTVVPKDTLACIWIYSLHRNPKYWTRPDDFWPERWTRPKTVPKGAYLPFAYGPRNCVGQPLAQLVLRSLLIGWVKRYQVKSTMVKDMQAGFTVLPLDGLELEVTKRGGE